MSRTDNYIGLSPNAQKWLNTNCQKVIVTTIREWPKDRVTKIIKSERNTITEVWGEIYDEIEGAFYNKFPLKQYYLGNSRIAQEVVQEEPWSGGPCYFLCLKDAETGKILKETMWEPEEIKEIAYL